MKKLIMLCITTCALITTQNTFSMLKCYTQTTKKAFLQKKFYTETAKFNYDKIVLEQQQKISLLEYENKSLKRERDALHEIIKNGNHATEEKYIGAVDRDFQYNNMNKD